MRFLVKRWHKATGTGSGTSPCVNRNGLSQITGEDAHRPQVLKPDSCANISFLMNYSLVVGEFWTVNMVLLVLIQHTQG